MMKRTFHLLKGFTLTELLVTFAILIVLGALAVPAYINYLRRSYFSDVVSAAETYKTSITECFHKQGKLAGCSGGLNHIPANITKVTGSISSLTVVDGVITVVPVPGHGITASDTYVLTPIIDKDNLKWKATGGAVADDYANLKTNKATV